MNKRSRQLFRTSYDKAGLSSDFRYDGYEFVNYEPNNSRFCRVARFVGASRCIVVFNYERNPLIGHASHRSKVSFLHEDGTLVKFDSRYIGGDNRHSWDRRVGGWLIANGAQQFKGRGWADKLAETMVGVALLWRSTNPWSQDES